METTKPMNDDLTLLPALLGLSGSSSIETSPSSGVLSIFDTPMLSDDSASFLFPSSASINESDGLDIGWGDEGVENDANMLWESTQFDMDELPHLTSLNNTSEGSTNPQSAKIPYGNHIQRLASLSGEIFAQTNVHRNDLSPMDSIRILIAHAISSSSALFDILSSLCETLAQQDFRASNHHTVSLLDTESSQLDTATTLQILTVYIRLIELHFTLYTRIQAMVSPPTSPSTSCTVSTPSSNNLTPPAFPSLSIGGISLAAYSRFQLRFLLQICVHHLGEIETLLGLPAGLRVSDVGEGSREHGGLLGERDGVTSLLVQTIMMGAGAPVRGIGETLEQLRKALEGRIKI